MDFIEFIHELPQRQNLRELYNKGEIQINPFEKPDSLYSILRDNPGIKIVYYQGPLVCDTRYKNIAEYVFFRFPEVELFLLDYKNLAYFRNQVEFEEKYKDFSEENPDIKSLGILINVDNPNEIKQDEYMTNLYDGVRNRLKERIENDKYKHPRIKDLQKLDYLHYLLRNVRYTEEYDYIRQFEDIHKIYTIRDLEDYPELALLLTYIDSENFREFVYEYRSFEVYAGFKEVKDMSKLIAYIVILRLYEQRRRDNLRN